MNNEDLIKLGLPTAKIVKEPISEAERRHQAALTLREYFHTFDKRYKVKAEDLYAVTLFLEPFPILSVYRDGDEKLPMNKRFFRSFRVAKRIWLKEIDKFKKNAVMLTKGRLK